MRGKLLPASLSFRQDFTPPLSDNMSGGLYVSCSLSPVIPAPDPQPMPSELLPFFRLSLGFTHHHHMPPFVALVQRRGYLPANRKTCLRSKEWGGSPEQLINLLARCRHSPLTP